MLFSSRSNPTVLRKDWNSGSSRGFKYFKFTPTCSNGVAQPQITNSLICTFYLICFHQNCWVLPSRERNQPTREVGQQHEERWAWMCAHQHRWGVAICNLTWILASDQGEIQTRVTYPNVWSKAECNYPDTLISCHILIPNYSGKRRLPGICWKYMKISYCDPGCVFKNAMFLFILNHRFLRQMWSSLRVEWVEVIRRRFLFIFSEVMDVMGVKRYGKMVLGIVKFHSVETKGTESSESLVVELLSFSWLIDVFVKTVYYMNEAFQGWLVYPTQSRKILRGVSCVSTPKDSPDVKLGSV